MSAKLLLLLGIILQSTNEPKAEITASSGGKPLEVVGELNISLGQQIKLSSEKAIHASIPNASLKWHVKPSTVQVETFPDGDAIVLTGPTVDTVITVQQIVSLNDAISFQEITIICGKGAQPPPVPTPVQPVNPTGSKRLFISLVSDTSKMTPDEAIIRNSVNYWNKLKVSGHDWIFYDSLSTETKGKAAILAAQEKKVSFPALVFDHDGKTVSVIPLPKTLPEIDAEIARLGGVK